MTIDFEGDSTNKPPVALAQLAQVAEEQVRLEARVEGLEADLKAAKEDLRRVSEDLLPDMMASVGMSEFKLSDGSKISIKREVSASIPEANRERAWDWMAANGLDGMIKTEVVTQFGSGEIDEATELLREIQEEHPDMEPLLKRNVHPQTLKAWVRERMEAGNPPPSDIFSVYPFNKTIVEKPAKRSSKYGR